MSSESPETIRTTTNLKIVFALRKNGVLILLLIVLLITDLILMRRTIISHKEIRIKDSVIHSIVSDNFALEYIGSNLFYTFEYDGMKIQDIPIKDTADRTVYLQKVVCEKTGAYFPLSATRLLRMHRIRSFPISRVCRIGFNSNYYIRRIQ